MCDNMKLSKEHQAELENIIVRLGEIEETLHPVEGGRINSAVIELEYLIDGDN